MNSIIEYSQKDWNKFLEENNITKQQVDYYLNNILDTPAFDKEARSYLGRFTNHSSFKNIIFKEIDNGEVIAVCIKDIQLGEEILVDYRDHFLKW